MCFFGSSNKSQPVSGVQALATQAQEQGAFDQARADEQARRRIAASDAAADTGSAMTAQATAAPKTVLGA
jgi:hypothetical protein